MSKSLKIIATLFFLVFGIYLLFPFEIYQDGVVGTEVTSPCHGILGLRRVRFVEETVSNFEAYAHGETYCLFTKDLTKSESIKKNKENQSPLGKLYQNIGVTVEENSFVIHDDELEVASYRYTQSSDGDTLLYVPEVKIAHATNDTYFVVEAVPLGCMSQEDLECLKFMAKAIGEEKKFGGIWKVNRSSKHVESVMIFPDKGQYEQKVTEFHVDNDNQTLEFMFELRFEDDVVELIEYEIGL